MEGLKIYILGCPSEGIEGLSSEAKLLLKSCDIALVSERFYEFIPNDYRRVINFVKFPEKFNHLPAMIKDFYERGFKKICIIATGDPNFFGITNFLKKFFPDSIERIIPSLSIMQEAFAKLKLSWEDASFFSLHGRKKSSLLSFLLKANKGFMFTSDDTDVLLLLNLLKEHRLSDFKIHILENLGMKDESYKILTYPYFVKSKIAPLNVIVFERTRKSGNYPGIGIDDEAFEYKKGMITKKEVRANIISLLALREGHVLWDVGAGSGSVSIEASFNPDGVLVYAIEKDEESYLNIKKNIDKFGAINVIPILSDFQSIFDTLPVPDRIFVGGSSGDLVNILRLGIEKLKKDGIMVISLVTLQSLNDVINFCKDKRLFYELYGILPIRGKKLKDSTIFNTQNLVYIVRLKK